MTAMTGARPRVLSGMQPQRTRCTSATTWVRDPVVALQETHDAFYCVVDLHAITAGHDPQLLRHRTRVTVRSILPPALTPNAASCSCRATSPNTRSSRGSSVASLRSARPGG